MLEDDKTIAIYALRKEIKNLKLKVGRLQHRIKEKDLSLDEIGDDEAVHSGPWQCCRGDYCASSTAVENTG